MRYDLGALFVGSWLVGAAGAYSLSARSRSAKITRSPQIGPEPGYPGRIERTPFGVTPEGHPVDRFTLTNSRGMIARITNYGAILTELHVPDRTGAIADIVLGFDTLEGYLAGSPYFGATIGRVANRIAKGEFTLDGKVYHVPVNNGPNSLHGGIKGFDKVIWDAHSSLTPLGPEVRLTYLSPDGEEGYPGNLATTVAFTITEGNELRIEYTAVSNAPTPVNLTNHTYFNLAGAGNVLDHEVMLSADAYTPVDDTLIPTGEIKSVTGTPFDFTRSTAIGARIDQLTGDPGGYDHNMVLNSGGARSLAARVYEPQSGRVMEVETDQPGVQFYTGNFLDSSITGKHGQVYQKHAALCLETQHFPDSVNHPNFPNTILRPGQTFHSTTIYRFLTR